MAGGRYLGDVFFSISFDAAGARTKADAALKKSLAGLKAEIPVSLDVNTRGAIAAVTAFAAKAKVIADRLDEMRIGANTRQAEFAIAKLQGKLDDLLKSADFRMSADTKKLDQQILAKIADIRKLQAQMSGLQMDVNTKRAALKLAQLEDQRDRLEKRLEDLEPDADNTLITRKLDLVEAQIELIKREASDVDLVASNVAFLRAIGVAKAELAGLQAQARDIRLGGNVDTTKLAASELGLLGITAAMEKLDIAAKKAAADTGPAFAIISGGGRYGFGAQIAGIKGWHLALDAALESVIAVAGAAIALGAGLAAIAEPAFDIGVRLKAVDVTSAALGQDIPPLTGKFDDLATAMAPRTIELYGAGLRIVQGQAGNLASTFEPVVHLFDIWAAKVVIWISNSRKFSAAVQGGTDFLRQFGDMIGNLVSAFDNLLQKDPGIAHYFLDLFVGAAQVLNVFSKLPAPLLQTALAIHGVYLWTKVLAVAPILGMAKALGILSNRQAEAAVSALKFKNIASFLLTNPYGWAIDAAAALGFLIYQTTQASNATRIFIANLEQGLNRLSGSDAIFGLSQAIGQLNSQIARTTPASELKGWNSLGNTFRSVGDDARAFGSEWAKGLSQILSGDTISGLKNVGKAIKDLFVPGGGAGIQAATDIAKLRGEIDKLGNAQGNLIKTMGHFASQGYTVEASLALMTLAGVKWNDTQQQMVAEVENLIAGYKNITGTGGALENSVNAVTFAALQQQEKVAQLNDGWDAFFKTITGGIGGFLSFAQQTIGLYQTLSGSGLKLNESNGRVSASMKLLGQQAGDTKVSMTGLNLASINAQQTFLQSAQAANQQADNLSLLANAAGLGDRGVSLLGQAMKDMVASLLPAAKGSQALTDVLYALAQRGGYQGANSFRALSEWVGKTKNPMKDLQGITATLTHAAADLVTDVQNLSLALGTTLNNAMAGVIFTFTGGKKALTDFAAALKTSTFNSKEQQKAALELGNQLIGLTGNAHDAHNEFVTFATRLGLTKDQADLLWKEISGRLTPALGTQADKVLPAVKNMFRTFAEAGLNYTQAQGDKLWQQITAKLGPGLNALGNLASGPAKAKFIDWAQNGLHLSQQKAFALWNELVTLQSKINALHGKTVTLQMIATGTGGVKVTSTQQGIAAKLIALNRLGLAAGGFISGPGGPRGDRIPAMLSDGEYVQQASAVSKYGVRAMDAVNKGKAVIAYASGGLISGVPGYPARVSQAVASDGTAALADTGQKVLQAMVSEIRAKMQAQAALIRSLSTATGGFGGNFTGGGPGTLSATQIEGYWEQAGGPGGQIANIAQAITVPESGRRPGAVQQGQPYATTGWGLWQITPGNSEPQAGINQALLNPRNNAIAAVAKYVQAGYSFRPWTTYVNGLYRPYLLAGGGLVPGYADGTGGAAPGWAWVGENGPELVKFKGGEQVIPNVTAGYAKGTKPPQAEINAGLSLFARYVQSGLLSLAKINSLHTTFLRDIARYYTGGALRSREQLVNRQTTAMENASKKLTALQKQSSAASAYQKQVTSDLSSYGGLSGVIGTTSPAPVSARDISSGLAQKLRNLNDFNAAIKGLQRKHLAKGLLQQVIAMGPDDGLAYARALLTSPGVIGTLNATSAAISKDTTAIGKTAAVSVYGTAAAAGFKSQEKQLTALMTKLGRTLGVEAARWLRVPKSKLPKGYASGTGYAHPGWAMVGENGPELMLFRGGEQVVPWNGAGGGTPAAAPAGGDIHVHLHLSNAGVIGSKQELETWLTSSINNLARTGRLAYALRRSPSA